MASLRHPNVVGFLGVCAHPPCVVTEYCGRGSLTDVLRGGAKSPAKAAQIDWPRRLNMALDAAKGMLYLVRRGGGGAGRQGAGRQGAGKGSVHGYAWGTADRVSGAVCTMSCTGVSWS